MITLLTVLSLLLLARCWQVARRRRRRGEPVLGKAGRRSAATQRRSALLMVVAILGLQALFLGPSASAAACGEAPNPERPGSGMVGALDPAHSQGEAGSAYFDYSYAGAVWHVFETDCGPLSGITDPNSTIDTWAGNQLFNLGKNIVGATNSLHYTVMKGGLLTPLYDAVRSGAEKVYNNIYGQLFGLAALLLAIMLFRNIWRGDLSAVSKRALYALAGVWLAASSFAMLRFYDEIDSAIVQTTTNIQAGFVDESENRVIRHVLPTNLHNEVVYKNWLRGEFGSPEAPQAEQFGRPLLDAQAFTWAQVRDGADADQAVVDAKKAEFKEISTQLGPATGYFTGEDGSRTGSGLLAFLQSLVYSLFQLFAKAAVLLAQVLVRLFTLTAPLIGLVALLHHDILRRVAKVAGAVAFNLVVLSVLAGVHALLLQAIFDAGSALSMLTQMVMAGLVTILLFLVGRPGRRLWQMVEMSVGMVGSAVPSPKSGLFSRFRKQQEGPTPQDEFWQNVRDTDDVAGNAEKRGPLGATVGGRRVRPEASTVFASAQRMDGAAAGQRPAAAWSGAWPGGEVSGPGSRPGLPAGGTGAEYPAFRPGVGAPGDYMPAGSIGQGAGFTAAASRRVDTAPVSDRRWDRGEDPDPVVVPSRMSAVGADTGGYQRSPAQLAYTPDVPQPRTGPRRVDPEVVAGKPVFVLYRPSRGLEVREDFRDTDRAVRG
ncbi:magnesium transporter [Amycolatopsis marina]|uniref:magnesium transporter n=1 Tax=Amycolatopsis marina TaxID=490629 RepID=UPI000B841DEF|nr:magnesium transporter [Amycolatopsis marina]